MLCVLLTVPDLGEILERQLACGRSPKSACRTKCSRRLRSRPSQVVHQERHSSDVASDVAFDMASDIASDMASDIASDHCTEYKQPIVGRGFRRHADTSCTPGITASRAAKVLGWLLFRDGGKVSLGHDTLCCLVLKVDGAWPGSRRGRGKHAADEWPCQPVCPVNISSTSPDVSLVIIEFCLAASR